MKDDIFNLSQGALHIAIKEEAARLFGWLNWEVYNRCNRNAARKLGSATYKMSVYTKRKQLRAIRFVAEYEAEHGVIEINEELFKNTKNEN